MDIKVVIFEDNSGLREMLFQIINFAQGLACTGAYPNALDLDHKMKISQPDIVLMDIDMPGRTGIEAVRLLNEYFSSPPKVLMLTVYDDTDNIFEAIKAGAIGYLLKKTPREKIIESIREVNEGGAAMTPSIAMKVLGAFQQPKTNLYKLTDKENEVLRRLVAGDSYKLIGFNLQMSIGTVQTHITHIYEKLHVNSKGEAISLALRDKLI